MPAPLTTRAESAEAAAPRKGLQAPNAWRVLALLTVINLLNFYDRTLPAIIVEPLKAEFGLTDTHIGLMSGAFTVLYAVAGIVLGRMADTRSRKVIMGIGLAIWSVMTAATGLAVGFGTLLIARIGVGIGEASYAPAANGMIADLFPAAKRSRATSLFQIGLPLGTVLAFFTTGQLIEAFGTWRAPFFLAAIPGLIFAIWTLFIREPRRGASETTATSQEPVAKPLRTLASIRTLRWLTLAGIGTQFAIYSVSAFLVPLFQRYFGMTLTAGATMAGLILGVAGLLGLLLGGVVADRFGARSPRGRVLTGAVALAITVPLSILAFQLGAAQAGLFVGVFMIAWMLQFLFYTATYPAIADVVEPRLRSTAMALFFAAAYLLGGAFGPIIVGALSDHLAAGALAAGMVNPVAIGLHSAMAIVIPVGRPSARSACSWPPARSTPTTRGASDQTSDRSIAAPRETATQRAPRHPVPGRFADRATKPPSDHLCNIPKDRAWIARPVGMTHSAAPHDNTVATTPSPRTPNRCPEYPRSPHGPHEPARRQLPVP